MMDRLSRGCHQLGAGDDRGQDRLTTTVFGLTDDILGSSARNLQIGRELFRVDAVEVIEVFVSCADERRLEEAREGERGDGGRGHGILPPDLAWTRKTRD